MVAKGVRDVTGETGRKGGFKGGEVGQWGDPGQQRTTEVLFDPL